MRQGHGPSGVTGIVTDPKQMKIWALSAAAITNLSSSIKNMTEETSNSLKHKEESPGRIKSDAADRNTLEEMLSMYMGPLNPDEHSQGTIQNIVTGQIAPDSVNVENAVAIGTRKMKEFRDSWPDGFYKTIKKDVVLFNVKQRHILIEGKKVFDPNLVYLRAVGLLVSKRDLDFNLLMSHELSSLPASMFSEEGAMRNACSKSTLTSKLQIEVNARNVFHAPRRVLVIDAAALVWTLKWPVYGKPKVGDIVEAMNNTISDMLKECDVYCVFDRYVELSTKSYPRMLRLDKSIKVFKFSIKSPLPAKSVVLCPLKIKCNYTVCSKKILPIQIHHQTRCCTNLL